MPPNSSRLKGADDFLDSPSPGQFLADLFIFEDNTSTVSVLEKGYSQKLAHLTRTHRVNLHWLAEVCASQGIHVGHIGTDDQAGDIFTKAFTDPIKWDTLCKLVGMYETNVFRSHPGSSSSGKAKALCLRDFRAEPVANMAAEYIHRQEGLCEGFDMVRLRASGSRWMASLFGRLGKDGSGRIQGR